MVGCLLVVQWEVAVAGYVFGPLVSVEVVSMLAVRWFVGASWVDERLPFVVAVLVAVVFEAE